MGVYQPAGIPRIEKGQPLGVATLGVDSKVPASQIAASITGGLSIQGVYDASTNTPDLSQVAAQQDGHLYIVSVDGTQDIGNGPEVFTVGDSVFYSTIEGRWFCLQSTVLGIEVIFDNTGTNIVAVNIQGAVVELDTRLQTLEAKVTSDLPNTVITTNQTFYISNSGNNSNDGSTSSRWENLYGLQAWQSDKEFASGVVITVLAENGTYDGVSINRNEDVYDTRLILVVEPETGTATKDQLIFEEDTAGIWTTGKVSATFRYTSLKCTTSANDGAFLIYNQACYFTADFIEVISGKDSIIRFTGPGIVFDFGTASIGEVFISENGGIIEINNSIANDGVDITASPAWCRVSNYSKVDTRIAAKTGNGILGPSATVSKFSEYIPFTGVPIGSLPSIIDGNSFAEFGDYDNSNSGLDAENKSLAIDEIVISYLNGIIITGTIEFFIDADGGNDTTNDGSSLAQAFATNARLMTEISKYRFEGSNARLKLSYVGNNTTLYDVLDINNENDLIRGRLTLELANVTLGEVVEFDSNGGDGGILITNNALEDLSVVMRGFKFKADKTDDGVFLISADSINISSNGSTSSFIEAYCADFKGTRSISFTNNVEFSCEEGPFITADGPTTSFNTTGTTRMNGGGFELNRLFNSTFSSTIILQPGNYTGYVFTTFQCFNANIAGIVNLGTLDNIAYASISNSFDISLNTLFTGTTVPYTGNSTVINIVRSTVKINTESSPISFTRLGATNLIQLDQRSQVFYLNPQFPNLPWDGAINIVDSESIQNLSFYLLSIAPESSGVVNALKRFINPINVSAGSSTVNPPTNLISNDRFAITDSRGNASVNSITVDFVTATQNLHGSSQNYVLNNDKEYVEFLYVNSTIGWIIK